MGKPAVKRPAVHKATYERVTMQPPRAENQIVPFSVLKNRKAGTRTWMRFDATGNSEIFDCDRNGLLKRVAVPARDLRILGPIFSQSSHILGNIHQFWVL
jgi:magnesium transporter